MSSTQKKLKDEFAEFLQYPSKLTEESPKTAKGQKRGRSSQANASTTMQEAKKTKLQSVNNIITKVMNIMDTQNELRNQNNEELLQALMDITNQMQTDLDLIKHNKQKLHRFLGVIMNGLKQNTVAYEEKLSEFKKIIDQFKQKSDELNTKHGEETNNIAKHLENDINKLKHQLVVETKRADFENVKKCLFHDLIDDSE